MTPSQASVPSHMRKVLKKLKNHQTRVQDRNGQPDRTQAKWSDEAAPGSCSRRGSRKQQEPRPDATEPDGVVALGLNKRDPFVRLDWVSTGCQWLLGNLRLVIRGKTAGEQSDDDSELVRKVADAQARHAGDPLVLGHSLRQARSIDDRELRVDRTGGSREDQSPLFGQVRIDGEDAGGAVGFEKRQSIGQTPGHEGVLAVVGPKTGRQAARTDPRPEGRKQEDGSPRVRLWELKPNSCRWPSGGPRERAQFFCGKPTERGCSWCPEHRRRVFTKSAVASVITPVAVMSKRQAR
jgi:GcrA cell cycle regulator